GRKRVCTRSATACSGTNCPSFPRTWGCRTKSSPGRCCTHLPPVPDGSRSWSTWIFQRKRSGGVSLSMSKPSVAEVRAGGHPAGIKERTNEVHWAGRLYMWVLSPYVSTVFFRLGVSPCPITYLMMVFGVLSGVEVAFGGVWSAYLAAVVSQIYR